ncbi:hypothetical protein LEMLEM_LOCUS8845, partial [Lemmus lemmus]
MTNLRIKSRLKSPDLWCHNFRGGNPSGLWRTLSFRDPN